MITLEDNRLSFRFSEVHDDANCSIEFQRTLRIPDDDKWSYPASVEYLGLVFQACD